MYVLIKTRPSGGKKLVGNRHYFNEAKFGLGLIMLLSFVLKLKNLIKKFEILCVCGRVCVCMYIYTHTHTLFFKENLVLH